MSLEAAGDLSYRLTTHGAWATSRAPHLYYFFKQIQLANCRLFIDLGSGDGIVTHVAGLFTTSMGIEADKDLCCIAKNMSRELDLAGRVHFICGDYRTQRIRNADYLYIYPDKPLNTLEEVLVGWRGKLLVYGPHIPPHHLPRISQMKCGKETLTQYGC